MNIAENIEVKHSQTYNEAKSRYKIFLNLLDDLQNLILGDKLFHQCTPENATKFLRTFNFTGRIKLAIACCVLEFKKIIRLRYIEAVAN